MAGLAFAIAGVISDLMSMARGGIPTPPPMPPPQPEIAKFFIRTPLLDLIRAVKLVPIGFVPEPPPPPVHPFDNVNFFNQGIFVDNMEIIGGNIGPGAPQGHPQFDPIPLHVPDDPDGFNPNDSGSESIDWENNAVGIAPHLPNAGVVRGVPPAAGWDKGWHPWAPDDFDGFDWDPDLPEDDDEGINNVEQGD